ncbi:MAG: membrane protein [Gemmatimonadales bacterium]|nr:MAG: membrane protein [Gemmatimonadales bacterium]
MTERLGSVPAAGVERPPYWGAVAVFAVVLAGYIWTLAPTVTFWDAGEFIATAKILGIPHPPGTPLFVLLAHVWADVVRIGEYAFRTNLMTAVFSAGAAAFFFLVAAQGLKGRAGGEKDRLFVVGGAAAAAVCSAFVFTVWQNSVETEVYMVATFSIAAICWLAWVWRKHRGTPRAPHVLLLIVYLMAVSVGNHLLTLLVGPALVSFMWYTIQREPLKDEGERRVERAQLAVVTGVWALLVGTGMGSTGLLFLGGLIFAGAAVYAASAGALLFAASVLVLAVAGASTYLFLYVRAGLNPMINEADPSTWESLWAVIRREQYPPRSPLDNPIYPSGPDNPGRSLTIIWLQIVNYLQYFDWQWANSLGSTDPVFARNTPLIPGLPIPARLPFTLLFTSLGIYGAQFLKRRDAGLFWLLIVLWLTTGFGLVGYINFKPGYSIGYDQFPDANMHEVRERDYFFTVSFQVWGLLAGIGAAALYRRLKEVWEERGRAAVRFAPLVLGLGALPFLTNFKAASRAHGPAVELARDFAYNLLQSVEPYGIIFTNGDNDTFPLWYIQEVEGVRQDVAVVNLSLGNTDWYIRQLRDNPVRRFDPAQAPWFADLAPAEPPPPLHTLSDEEIASLQPRLLSRSLSYRAGRVETAYREGTPLYVKDILILRLLQENYQRRPVYFSITAGTGSWLGLNRYMTQEGLVLRIHASESPDSSRLAPGLLGIPVDVPRTEQLVWEVYRYAGLLEADTLILDPTNSNIATNLSIPPLSLGQAYEFLGDREKSIKNLELAYQLSPSRQLAEVIATLKSQDTAIPLADSGSGAGGSR